MELNTRSDLGIARLAGLISLVDSGRPVIGNYGKYFVISSLAWTKVDVTFKLCFTSVHKNPIIIILHHFGRAFHNLLLT